MSYYDTRYEEQLKALSVFRGIINNSVINKLFKLLSEKTAEAYGEFVHALYEYTDNFSEYLLNAVLEDENTYMLRLAKMCDIPDVINKAAHSELLLLQQLSLITPNTIKELAGIDYELAEWHTSKYDFIKIYAERMSQLQTKGYGIFAKYHAFVLKDGVIVPVKNPDKQQLSQLEGYETERRKVIDNTLALLNNKPAANALLYGDAGTGKSSTVKAAANEYCHMGLRLIELKKSQLHELPALIESIAKNPLKFIIFIDDLSFSSDDDDFGALKAVLEGSVTSKTPNLVIYATSNRRHLVKEKFSDRDGDDIHANDSREELTSLSERFGLKVTFLKPDKALFIQIVETLAKQYEIECNEVLFQKAEMYALRRNGRSGRAAKQFIESVKAGLI